MTENETSPIRYVEELEAKDDYWLSITDAARVCRIQDVSLRRAIAAGRLPVREKGAGDNRRTRFVRASDLERAGYPVLDSGAAITSEIRKVDVLNLPLQQKVLNELYQQLATRQENQETALTGLREEETQIAAHLATFRQEQADAQVQTRQWLEGVHTGQQERLDTLSAAGVDYQRQLTQLLERIGAQDQRHDQLAHLVETLQQEQDHLRQAQTDLQASIENLRLEMQERLQQSLKGAKAEYQAALSCARQEIGAEQEQKIQELYTRVQNQIQGVERDEARDVEMLTATQERQAERIDAQGQQATITTQRSQDRLDATSQRIDELEKRLQAEQEARIALEARLQAQKAPTTKRKAEPSA